MSKQIKNAFQLNLSVSIKKARTKEEGKTIVQYHYYENIPIHNDKRMTEIFSEHLQSTNIWSNGYARKSSFSNITGVMLDFDNKNGMDQISINEFIRGHKDVHFILYPSSNHLKHTDENGIPIEKFRVVLPFDPTKYDYYKSEDMQQRVYQGALKEFPAMDPTPTGTHSKFFPSSLGDTFYVKVNVGKDYYTPKLKPRKIDFKVFQKVPRFTLDTEIGDDKGRIYKVGEINNKTSILCPFCDQEKREGNPGKNNASIDVYDHGTPQIFCASCKSNGKGVNKNGVFYLDPDEAYTIQSRQLNVCVFRDILTDKYFLGAQSKKSNEFEFNQVTKQNIPNALITREMDVPSVYDKAEFGYDFSEREKIFDLENGFVNRFIAPKVLKDTVAAPEHDIPINTGKVIRHFVGECPDVYQSFINHLAYMVQTGDKLRVAFLFQGVQGTGKGLFFSKVISAIFGRQYCTQTLHHSFLKEFNTWLETNYCLLVDEVEADFSNKADVLARVLKQVIGDKWIAVEGKGADIKNGCINANLFFGTNKRNGLILEPSDRRFIIGAWQDKKIYDQLWWLGDSAMAEALEKEVPAFVAYLKGQPVDRTTLNRVVNNDARELLIEISKTNTEMFFESIKNGGWDWIRECLINNVSDPFDKYRYEDANRITTGISSKKKLSRDDLRTLYNNIFQENKQAHSFTRLCKMHGLEVKQMKIDGINQQGVEIVKR